MAVTADNFKIADENGKIKIANKYQLPSQLQAVQQQFASLLVNGQLPLKKSPDKSKRADTLPLNPKPVVPKPVVSNTTTLSTSTTASAQPSPGSSVVSASKKKPPLPRSKPSVKTPLQELNTTIDMLNERINAKLTSPKDPAPQEYLARLNGVQHCTDSKTLEEFYNSDIKKLRDSWVGRHGLYRGLLENTKLLDSDKGRLQETIDNVTGYSAYRARRNVLLEQEATALANAQPISRSRRWPTL